MSATSAALLALGAQLAATKAEVALDELFQAARAAIAMVDEATVTQLELNMIAELVALAEPLRKAWLRLYKHALLLSDIADRSGPPAWLRTHALATGAQPMKGN